MQVTSKGNNMITHNPAAQNTRSTEKSNRLLFLELVEQARRELPAQDTSWPPRSAQLFQNTMGTSLLSRERLTALPILLMDQYTIWSLENMEALSKSLPGEKSGPVSDHLETMERVMNESTDGALIARCERLFHELVPHSTRSSLHSYYNVRALDSYVMNAFSTGATVFITSELANLLTDEELQAVMAHELAHNDKAHSLNNVLDIVKTFGFHFKDLVKEEIHWMRTGEQGELLKRTIEEGIINPVLEDFSAHAPEVEIEADVHAVGILQRAGLDPQNLINALIKLHDGRPQPNADEVVRQYPELGERVEAIKEAMGKYELVA
ncbi:MAG: M48 family metalloprotease [bacterium]|nr:M56 family metallopeptidase [bacterium]MBU1918376.1 M56 family metallopeptidase [bacterium]